VKKVLLRVVFIFIILIIGIVIAIPVMNDYTVSSLIKEMKKIPLPPQTELIEAISSAGKLVGNGNGMQYFGALLVKSELSLDELDSYYSQYRKNDWSYIVNVQSGSKITAVEHRVLEFKELRDVTDFKGYYIVYSWGESKFTLADLDIRGN